MTTTRGSVTVRVNPKGAQRLLTSQAVQANLDARAERIRAVAGEGFTVRRRPERRRRYGVQVRTDGQEGRKKQAESNTLTRALDAGRGR